TYQQVDITKSVLLASNPSLDFSHLKQINFVEDSNLTNPDIGSLDIKTGGLDFVPVLTGSTYVQANLTNLTGRPAIGTSVGSTTNDPDGTISLSQTDGKNFSVTYG